MRPLESMRAIVAALRRSGQMRDDGSLQPAPLTPDGSTQAAPEVSLKPEDRLDRVLIALGSSGEFHSLCRVQRGSRQKDVFWVHGVASSEVSILVSAASTEGFRYVSERGENTEIARSNPVIEESMTISFRYIG